MKLDKNYRKVNIHNGIEFSYVQMKLLFESVPELFIKEGCKGPGFNDAVKNLDTDTFKLKEQFEKNFPLYKMRDSFKDKSTLEKQLYTKAQKNFVAQYGKNFTYAPRFITQFIEMYSCSVIDNLSMQFLEENETLYLFFFNGQNCMALEQPQNQDILININQKEFKLPLKEIKNTFYRILVKGENLLT
ncbi:MAG: hypothetical protein MJ182_08950 [Treponema sp.]|nr:hypothetical protein [Treponema sp.]